MNWPARHFGVVVVIGLSSSYYGFQKIPIYESAEKVFGLGFGTVELGAGHNPEPKVWDAVKRIKRDFPDKNYTVHGLFPPLEKRFWFNASLGLTKQNEKIVENFFRAAQIVEAKVVSIHPGFRKEIEWLDGAGPMHEFLQKKKIPPEKARQGFFALVECCLAKAEEANCSFAIENIPSLALPLVGTVQEFEEVFAKFPRLKMLLDVGHALYSSRLETLLEHFSGRIGQLHLHISRPEGQARKADEHNPVSSKEELEPLRAIRQLKKIPIIFEHSTNITEWEIKAEKRLLEGFLGGVIP